MVSSVAYFSPGNSAELFFFIFFFPAQSGNPDEWTTLALSYQRQACVARKRRHSSCVEAPRAVPHSLASITVVNQHTRVTKNTAQITSSLESSTRNIAFRGLCE